MSARESVVFLLKEWEKSENYADVLLEQFFGKTKLNFADRALVQEIFFGVIRWRKKLDFIIEKFFQGKISKAPDFVRFLLQTGIYQILFLERIPHYAVVNETVKMARARGGKYWGSKINAILRNIIRNSNSIKYPDPAKDIVNYISVVHSHPEWLIRRWLERWGEEETIQLCQANNQKPKITFRINRNKITAAQFASFLRSKRIKFQHLQELPDFFRVDSFQNFSNEEMFRQGFFSVQDASAGLAALLLDPRPEERILDLCAAPGGKSGYLMELSGGKAKIFSADLNYARLLLVKENLQRLGFPAQNLIQVDAADFASKPVDKVLVDVPCSGLGVMAKRVDLRWRRTEKEMKELPALQYDILENAAGLLKSGGVVVYSTCTIEPEENENIVHKFLDQHADFYLEDAKTYVPEHFVSENGWILTFPHRHHMDGSFAARIVKK